MSAVTKDSPLEFFTTKQLAERWHVSVQTIRNRVKTGLLPVCEVSPRKFLYKRSDIESYEQRHSGPGRDKPSAEVRRVRRPGPRFCWE